MKIVYFVLIWYVESFARWQKKNSPEDFKDIVNQISVIFFKYNNFVFVNSETFPKINLGKLSKVIRILYIKVRMKIL